MIKSQATRQVNRLLTAVADLNRLRLLKCLQVRPACFCELVQATQTPQSCVSRHLRTLRDAGLVVDTGEARWVEYALAQPPENSPEAELLELIAGWLERDPIVRDDRMRLRAASCDNCELLGKGFIGALHIC